MILVVGIWATIDTINANKAQQELDKKGKYTIVTVTNIKGAHSERWVDVEFVYNGNKYESERRNETIPLSWIGEKIFIKFLPTDLMQCEYYDNVEIPDSILKLPPTVWDSLPVKN